MEDAELELGYLARPDHPGPGVVMIHDVWGVSDHTRELARRLAREGFAVLAVDLYRREGAVSISDPGAWIRGLSDPQVVADVQAGADFLAADPAVAGRPVGVTGFCMGGQYALLAACACRGLSACVSFYGMLSHQHGLLAAPAGERLDPRRKPRSPLEAIDTLGCPLLGLFGREDPYIPVTDVQELERRLAAVAHPHEIVLYEGAGHAFMNDTRPDAYRPEVARQAWERSVAFLRRHLGS